MFEKEKGSPKVNDWCGLFKNKNVKRHVNLDMLKKYRFLKHVEMENVSSTYISKSFFSFSRCLHTTKLLFEMPSTKDYKLKFSLLQRNFSKLTGTIFLWGLCQTCNLSLKIFYLAHLSERSREEVSTETR